MAVTLIDSKHLGGTKFDLLFQIIKLGTSNVIDGQLFDVHDLVQMKFIIRNTSSDNCEILMSAMKHRLTMMLDVKMHVGCCSYVCELRRRIHTCELDFTCSETWSEYSRLFELQQAEKVAIHLDADITVSSCARTLDIIFIDRDFTDFELSTTEGSVLVHKACLASHSDVFKRMLCGEWKETTAGRIDIKGVTLKTLEDLKRYMYLGELPADGLCPLLRIAAYYMIDGLKALCTVQLAHSVTSENLYELLEFSYENNIPELTFAILRAVRSQPRDVIEVANKRMIKPKKKSATEKDENEKDETSEESKPRDIALTLNSLFE